MQPLAKDLQKPKKTLKEFRDIAVRILKYLPSVISEKKEKGDYYYPLNLMRRFCEENVSHSAFLIL